MVQIKKNTVQNAILKAAKSLYMKKGYVNTSMSEIARSAKVSTSNLYIYFDSKLDIMFALYRPWFIRHLDLLEEKTLAIEDKRERLETILLYVWRDIPASDNNFANNLVQALSTKTSRERYNRDLLLLSEARLSRLILTCLPESQRHWVSNDLLSHLMFMAHDGFAMNYTLEGLNGNVVKADRVEKIVKNLCDLLLHEAHPA